MIMTVMIVFQFNVLTALSVICHSFIGTESL